MKRKIYILIFLIFSSCIQESKQRYNHTLSSKDNILTIDYTGAGDVIQFKMFQGIYTNLSRQDSNQFIATLDIPNLNHAIFSYDLVIHEMDSLKQMREVKYKPENDDQKHFIWIGKHRNVKYEKSINFQSKMVYDTLESVFLDEPREITIYKSKQSNKDTPIIYFTDGNVVDEYAPYVDKLIEDQVILPVNLIGIHSNFTNRYIEYVDNGIDTVIFNRHEKFFIKEVINQYELMNTKQKRYMYGFSNGAAFAMYCGINYPEYFNEIIAFSTADYISKYSKPVEFKQSKYPNFYMGAGKYEYSIYRDNLNFTNKLKGKDIDVEFKTFVSGHDYNVWRIEFLKYLEYTFEK